MSSDEFAIRVRQVSKRYQIYDRPQDRLRQAVLPRLDRLVHPFSDRPPKHYFREFWALRDISFDVRRGDTIGIIGRNGAGKSTLLQIVCGTLTPTEGSVQINGKLAALLELGAGFNPEFTGRENVYLNGSILGLTHAQIDERFDAIAAFADIGAFIEQPIKTYSSGMIVRLAFAVIAHVDAEILVVDEALAVGDAFFTQKCMRFMRQFMETGTILFVSHDTASVINLCDRAIWIDGGHKKMDSNAKDVADSYLEALVEDRQGKSKASSTGQVPGAAGTKVPEATRKDPRQNLIAHSNYRNDIEIFSFRLDAQSFGMRAARISDVSMIDQDGTPLNWIVGGETVTIQIQAETFEPVSNPILGFLIRDRLGQILFGENTYLTYAHERLEAPANSLLTARFTFLMPLLPPGDYSITAAIAEGTQDDHVQQHYVPDALIFKSHRSSVTHGLVGIPFDAISMSVMELSRTASD